MASYVASLLLLVGLSAETLSFRIKPSLNTTEIPANRGAAAVWQNLKKLHTRASLIMITAHPDDEDGAMLAYESRGQGARVTLLTLNRGEGGANVMSSDYWDALGLVRTQELLAADRYYGVDQYWTRVCDYGFSKTMEEALAKWGKERVLGDVVRVVRMTRPLGRYVGVCGRPQRWSRQSPGCRIDGEGSVRGRGRSNAIPGTDSRRTAAMEAIQILRSRTFLRAVRNLRSPPTVKIPVGDYDPLLGFSYLQTSREGLGYQKSQNGGGSIPRAGSMTSDYHRFGVECSRTTIRRQVFSRESIRR